jgi:glycosyltransferase involved in cell wall biosynthesis
MFEDFTYSMAERAVRRLVVFAPLPPLENGIADYAVESLGRLSLIYEVTVVIDDVAPPPSQGLSYRVIRSTTYLANRSLFASDVHVFHFGNNPDHEYMLPIFAEVGGVVVLHDVSLHYLIDQSTIRWGETERYLGFLCDEAGDCGRILGEHFARNQRREAAMFHAIPMTRWLLDRALHVVVHSEFAKAKVLAAAPGARVSCIPHHLAPKAVSPDWGPRRDAARERLGVDDDTRLLVSLGFLGRAKQIEAVLDALSRSRDAWPRVRYVLAGKEDPWSFDVGAEIAKRGLDDIVSITGFIPEEEFFDYVAAADVVVNLRFPSEGETSGTLVRAMGVGAPIVVCDVGSFAEIPDGVVAKVAWSSEFILDVERVIGRLLNDSEERARLRSSSRDFAQVFHDLGRCTRSYAAVIEAAADGGWHQGLAGGERLHAFPPFGAARERLLRDAASLGVPVPLWFREFLVPLAEEETRLLVIQDSVSDVAELLRLFGWTASNSVIVSASEAIEVLESASGSFDVLVAIGWVPDDPRHAVLFARAMRLLAPRALAVVSSVRLEGCEETFAARGFSPVGRVSAPSSRVDLLDGAGAAHSYDACFVFVRRSIEPLVGFEAVPS